ncbi:MAG: acetylglutamate kinase [Gemmatimonadaceae bacterium]|nr:acetylglutamate kinase [Gemmatimonadaceae bacterium]
MRVIKLGGRAQNDPTLAAEIAAAWKDCKGELCVVHGGGDEITALQVALGKKPNFVNGRRVTTGDDIQLLRMVLSGVINKRLVSAFAKAGVRAVGISGEDGGLISAQRGVEGDELYALGAVGAPAHVNADLLLNLVSNGYMPVISPVASDAADPGGALNVNGDDAAAAVAAALHSSELIFVADVPGVLRDDAVMGSVALEEVPHLIAEGTVQGGMTAKLDAAKNALNGGVASVRISDIPGIRNTKRGTTVTNSATGKT